MYLIPLHSTYSYICEKYLHKFYIHFRCDIFAGQDIFNTTNSCISLYCELEDIKSITRKAESKNVADTMWCKSFFLNTIAEFIEKCVGDIEKVAHLSLKYHHLYRYVKCNCTRRLTVTELSKQMNMSVSNLSKHFRQDTGITLKGYIDSQLVQTAKERLLLEDLNIKQIGFHLGFSDEFYFSRFFKTHTGISPKEYRLRNRMK